MQSHSMVAIPMFVLMANFLTHSKVTDGLFLSIRYLLGPVRGGLGLAVILVSTVFAATTGIVGASAVTMGMLSVPILLKCGYKPSLACGMVCAVGMFLDWLGIVTIVFPIFLPIMDMFGFDRL